MANLTFSHLRDQNLPRCRRWHPEGAPPWSFSDWFLALGGEAGEALNVVKKLNRDRDGLAGNLKSHLALVDDLGGELADVVIYLDICLGWDFPERRLFEEFDFAGIRADTSHAAANYPEAAMTPSERGNWLFKSIARVDDGDDVEGRAFWARQVFRATDALAYEFQIDLAGAVIVKFNLTSERFGFPERLERA